MSEKEDGGQQTFSGEKADNTVSISVPILVVLILAVALVLLTLLVKRRQRTNTVNSFCLYIMFIMSLNDIKHHSKYILSK